MEEALKEYDLHVVESTEPDRRKIDFRIFDDHDTFCAEVSGDSPDGVEIDCEHPGECLDWGDDDECGECLLCGDQCNWGWVDDVVDEGYDEYGDYYAKTGKVRQIADWHSTDNRGLIGKYLKELAKKW